MGDVAKVRQAVSAVGIARSVAGDRRLAVWRRGGKLPHAAFEHDSDDRVFADGEQAAQQVAPPNPVWGISVSGSDCLREGAPKILRARWERVNRRALTGGCLKRDGAAGGPAGG